MINKPNAGTLALIKQCEPVIINMEELQRFKTRRLCQHILESWSELQYQFVSMTSEWWSL